jgi:hypothetical protein
VNLERANVVIRPRGALELVDLSFRFLLDINRTAYLRLSTFVLGPCFALCLFARFYLDWSAARVWLLALALCWLCQGPFTVLAGQLMFESDPSLSDTSRGALKRLGAYAVTLLWTRFLMLFGSLVIVGAFYFAARAVFVPECLYLEHLGPRAALRRGAQIARTHFDTVSKLVLTTLTATLFFVLVSETAIRGLLEALLVLNVDLGTLERDGISVWSLLGLFASVPWVSALRFLTYIDTRTRRDGWDIQVRFLALEHRHEGLT